MAPSPRPSLLRPFYPSLDGLRAIAFLAVFVHHYLYFFYRYNFLEWGWVGVDLFFVLSGFLITGILFDTLQRPDYFRNFYIRRTLRIFPLFYGLWFVLLLLTPVLHIAWNRANLMLALYLGNFITSGSRLHQNHQPGNIIFVVHGVVRHLRLGHLWSLCVEEQFYLLWPAVVWLVRSRKALLRVCLAVIVLLPIARGIYAHYLPKLVVGGRLYYSSWSRFDTLICGAAIALCLRGSMPSMDAMRKYLFATVAAAAVLLIGGYYFLGDPNIESLQDPFVSVVGYSLIAIGFGALLILALEPDSQISKLLQWRPLVYLGRISYGMYVYHYIFSDFFFLRKQRLAAHHLTILGPLSALILTVVIASLSFYFVEAPFLRLKSRFAPRANAVDDPAPAHSGIAFLIDGPDVEVES